MEELEHCSCYSDAKKHLVRNPGFIEDVYGYIQQGGDMERESYEIECEELFRFPFFYITYGVHEEGHAYGTSDEIYMQLQSSHADEYDECKRKILYMGG